MTEKHFKANKKIVVGFTGRIDSVVAAYLLKKQGYEVLAVSVIFFPREDEGLPAVINDVGDEVINNDFFCVNKLDELTQLKAIAQKMGISFYAVDASAEYKNFVGDKIIASRVAGISFSPEYEAHALLIDILNSKAELLEASYIATGHFAKLSLPQNNKPIRVLSSNDLAHDQCDFLSKVKNTSFNKLKLPLADMRKVEVRKIASTLDFNVLNEKMSWSEAINHPNFSSFVRRRLPLSMVKTGQMIDYSNDTYLFDHQGIHQFYVGQNKIKNNIMSLDPDFIVADIHYSSGTIIVIKPDKLKCEKVIIKALTYEIDEDISKPCYVYLKRNDHKERYRGLLSIKNNGFAAFTFEESQKMVLCRGETVTLLSHDGEGARIFGSGEVVIAGSVLDGKIMKLPQREEDINERAEVEKNESDFLY